MNISVLPAEEVVPFQRIYLLVLRLLQQAVTESRVNSHITVKRKEKHKLQPQSNQFVLLFTNSQFHKNVLLFYINLDLPWQIS